MEKIILTKICKSFNNNIVLNDFSAEIEIGKTSVIMGPSGCGKTTLMRIMMGLEKMDSGEIINIPSKKSAVFQEDRLCSEFGAVSNIKLGIRSRISRYEVEKVLNSVGIYEDNKKPVAEFSGGMARRVAIVRAMMSESDIIFMDEPFKGLDLETKLLVVNFVLSTQNGRTIIAVTHSNDEATLLGGQVINMTMPANG